MGDKVLEKPNFNLCPKWKPWVNRGQPKDMGNGVRENVLLKSVDCEGLEQVPLKQTSHFGSFISTDIL